MPPASRRCRPNRQGLRRRRSTRRSAAARRAAVCGPRPPTGERSRDCGSAHARPRPRFCLPDGEIRRIACRAPQHIVGRKSNRMLVAGGPCGPGPCAMPNRIAFWRKKRGLSQQELADLAGTSNQQISMLESGARRLTTDWMERLAKPLGITPAELLVTKGDTDFGKAVPVGKPGKRDLPVRNKRPGAAEPFAIGEEDYV